MGKKSIVEDTGSYWNPVYGTFKHKIMFYDTHERAAEVLIRMRKYGFRQMALLFRLFITGFLEEDPNLMKFLETHLTVKHKKKEKLFEYQGQSKEDIRQMEKEKKAAEKVKQKVVLKKAEDNEFSEEEMRNIFDIIEKEKPI